MLKKGEMLSTKLSSLRMSVSSPDERVTCLGFGRLSEGLTHPKRSDTQKFNYKKGGRKRARETSCV